MAAKGRLWWCNSYQARQTKHNEWVGATVGAPFIRSCATLKQKKLLNDNYGHKIFFAY